MKTTNKSMLLLISLATALSACDMKRHLDEMHDSTIEMNRTTKDMNERTSDLDTATGELYNALRQGDSLAARRSALDNLIKTPDAARKLSEAAKYFMSFEFQFWNDDGQDKGNDKRMELATIGAREFFKDIYQFIPDGEMTPKPFKGQIIATKKSNLVNSFNALAVTTHFLNPKQEIYLKEKPNMTSLSMNKMIEDSLLAKASIESGEKRLSDYPGYVAEVLANEAAAIYLLEARYNYLTALFLGRSTTIANDKFKAVQYVATHWTLDLTKFNAAQIEELNMFLTGALKTKALLKQIGVNPRTDVLLVRMFNNMTMTDIAKDASISANKIATFREITDKIKEIRKF